MSELVIIGNGPAAWSCAITALIRKLKVTVVGPGNDTSALNLAKLIDNYPGLPDISGMELLSRMKEQALRLGARENAGMVNAIMPGTPHTLMVQNEVFTADAIVLCLGAAQAGTLPGETEWLGQGVSYCATCDGRFYKDRKIAVLSESNEGIREAVYLYGLTQKVHYYPLKQHNFESLPQGICLHKDKPLAITRGQNGMQLQTEADTQCYEGIFIFRRIYPVQTLLSGLELFDEGIVTDRMQRTNIPGIFAAGDCTGKPHQLAKAVGEGNVAALAAADYLYQQFKH